MSNSDQQTNAANQLYWLKGVYPLPEKRPRRFARLWGFFLACSVLLMCLSLLLDTDPKFDWRVLLVTGVFYGWAEHARRNLRSVEVSSAGIKVEPLGLAIPASEIVSIERKKYWDGRYIFEVRLKSPKLYLYAGVWANGKRLAIGLD